MLAYPPKSCNVRYACLVTDGKVCDYCSIQSIRRLSRKVSGACSLKN